MTTDAEVEAFLAHWGVKGMKWGVRKDRNTNPNRNLTGGEKAVALVGGYSLGVAAGRQILNRTGNVMLVNLAWPVMGAGALFISKGLKKYRNVPMKQVRKSAAKSGGVDQSAEIARVEEFLKKNNV